MSVAGAGLAGKSSRAGHRRSRLNDLAIWSLLTLLAFAPIPLAGSRPALWPVFAALAGLLLTIYAFGHLRRNHSFALPAAAYRTTAFLWLALCAYVFVQLLPIRTSIPSAGGGELATVPQISITPGTTLLILVQLLGYGAAFWLAAQISVRASRARLLLVGIVAIVSGFAIYGLVALTQLGDTILGLEKWAYPGSATSTFVNRNSFATFLSLGLSCAVALTLDGIDRARELQQQGLRLLLSIAPALAAIALIAGTLFASNSRMGSFAGLAAVLVILLTRSITAAPGLAKLATLIVTAIVGAAIALSVYGQALMERLGSVEQDFDVRWQLYQQAWQLIWLRPLTGFGAGSFEHAFPLVHQLPVNVDLIWDRAHSTYLSLWSDFGLIAGSLPILAIVALGIVLLRHLLTSVVVSPNALAALGAIVVCTIHSTVDFSLEIQAVAYLFAAILGSGLGSTFVSRKLDQTANGT